ncbi:hypothetical protein PoB_001883700 [Plakobranchus ocellatus]|uniref:Uncharacterized protein n=1 Tax=Plakobranchus ocellatus TaxID=259542 RepID=A0AAV3ZCT7_9GAST|nr:hypothetical protein PoB_001883700 [Plakobranchus ocellatus]
MPQNVLKSVMTLREKRKKLYQKFYSERIQSNEATWLYTLHFNRPQFFSQKFRQSKEKPKQLTSKEERYQVLHTTRFGQAGRDINEGIFAHENSELPPTLTSQSQMPKGTKSEIITCLESEISAVTASPTADVITLDRAFIVQALRLGTASTFYEYASNVFLPHILSCLRSVFRLDVVKDIYKVSAPSYAIPANGDGESKMTNGNLVGSNSSFFKN